MRVIIWADRFIKYSFYLLFLLVPLAFTNNTSELFEFNKMWVTFGFTIIITAAWAVKMAIKRKFFVQRTPLDIPILLFLFSQIVSTIFSLDVHTSLWGYYSRFNGGLLSIISYIILYYAFASNLLTLKMAKKLLVLGLASGAVVALWGLPSHFGYDPTCLLFRGSFDVSCWTTDFQPKIRIFSTLGQPNWLAAYLGILIPLSLALAISEFKNKISKKLLLYAALSFLFVIDLLFTRSQSGFLGIVIALLVFVGFPIFKEGKIGRRKLSNVIKDKQVKILFTCLGIFILTVFFVGSPIDKLNAFTYQAVTSRLSNKKAAKPTTPTTIPALELNITDSGKIRSIVWKGAFDVWKHYPIFGSGVETFAYSYYKFRPVEHNQTSEWNYLYNKAHNEYLNFLATTGLFGFSTYLFMIFYFLYIAFKKLLGNNQQSTINNQFLIILALLAGYISILVTNFFGFSVVIINIYFFLIPAFALLALGLIDEKKMFVFPQKNKVSSKKTLAQKAELVTILVVALYLLFQLFRFWNGDKAYFMGSNLDRVQQFQTAYPYLLQAVQQRSSEPVFQDEFAINNGVLAASIISVDQTRPATESAKDESVITALLQNAIQTSNKVVAEHPNNITFWKSRVRLFYTLSQIDPKYLPFTLDAIKKAQQLAPTDATISYNLGILQGQSGDFNSAVKTLENTVKLRPAYREAHFGLALFYHQQAVDKNGKVINDALQQKAIEQMKYILEKIDPNDMQAQAALKSWVAL